MCFFASCALIENWDISQNHLLLFTKYNVFRKILSNQSCLFSKLKNSFYCCRTNCKWKFSLKMGQTLSSCVGCLSEPKKKPQKKSTIRFEEVGTIEIAEDPMVSNDEIYTNKWINAQWSMSRDSESTNKKILRTTYSFCMNQ